MSPHSVFYIIGLPNVKFTRGLRFKYVTEKMHHEKSPPGGLQNILGE